MFSEVNYDRRRPTPEINMAAAKPSNFAHQLTSGDVVHSCVGFVDHKNIGLAVGVLLQ